MRARLAYAFASMSFHFFLSLFLISFTFYLYTVYISFWSLLCSVHTGAMQENLQIQYRVPHRAWIAGSSHCPLLTTVGVNTKLMAPPDRFADRNANCEFRQESDCMGVHTHAIWFWCGQKKGSCKSLVQMRCKFSHTVCMAKCTITEPPYIFHKPRRWWCFWPMKGFGLV